MVGIVSFDKENQKIFINYEDKQWYFPMKELPEYRKTKLHSYDTTKMTGNDWTKLAETIAIQYKNIIEGNMYSVAGPKRFFFIDNLPVIEILFLIGKGE